MQAKKAAFGTDTTERTRNKGKDIRSQNVCTLQQEQYARAIRIHGHAVYLSETQRATQLFWGSNHFALSITGSNLGVVLP